MPLAKLHGSVYTGIMVAPTWNKTLAPNLLPAWKIAFNMLAQANHIRIIGYSLPVADAYIKYLLRAAAIESPHLKRIDILCLDRDGSVYGKYAEFVDVARLRFASKTVEDYLRSIHNKTLASVDAGADAAIPSIEFRSIESAHETFFESAGARS